MRVRDVCPSTGESAIDHDRVERDGECSGGPIHEFMAFIDHDGTVFGQYRYSFDGVDGKHCMISDDEVGLLRGESALSGETLRSECADGLTDALAATHREPRPHARIDWIEELITVTGLRGLRPTAHSQRLFA